MDKSELEEAVKEHSKWIAEQEKEHAVKNALYIRCMAVIGVVWAGLAWLGSKAVENFEVLRIMVEAAIKAQSK